jgi:hypothetical protein
MAIIDILRLVDKDGLKRLVGHKDVFFDGVVRDSAGLTAEVMHDG